MNEIEEKTPNPNKAEHPIPKQVPDSRFIPRNTIRNKPCPCGATKEMVMPKFKYNIDNKPIRGMRANSTIADDMQGPIMVPIKTKDCCWSRVESAYLSTLPKIVRNEGKKNWPASPKRTEVETINE